MTPPSARLGSIIAGLVLVLGLCLAPFAIAAADTGVEKAIPGDASVFASLATPLGIAGIAFGVMGLLSLLMLSTARSAQRP